MHAHHTPKPGKGAAIARDPIDIILPRLEGHGLKQRGPGKWVFRCPAHDDSNASAGLRELPDGRILINDFGGCSTESILSAIGLTMADLFPVQHGRDFDASQPKPKPPRFTASDLIRTAALESRIVALVAADMLAGKPVPESDLARMAQAVEILSAIDAKVNHAA